jgi:flavodoxin I
MKTLVIYDSQYGNTEKIAQGIGEALGPSPQVEVHKVGDLRPEQVGGIELLVVGSPTQRLRPTEAMTSFLKGIPKNALKGVRAAAFDTRFTEQKIKETSSVLSFFVRIYGYAARPIADHLKEKGAELVLPPEGFYVQDMQGPLMDGELERAADWARQILGAKAL